MENKFTGRIIHKPITIKRNMEAENINPPGPPALPECRHGVVLGHRNCQECKKDDIKIKELVHPLTYEYWESKGQDDLYHIVFRAYHMGMRKDHNN